MNKKICNIIFFFIVVCLIFLNIPKSMQMNMIGSVIGDKLVFYPLMIGLFYTIYCQYRYKNVFINFDKFKKYIFIFWGIMLLSTIMGLIIYPYYNLILNGPINQIEKLPGVLDSLHKIGIDINEKTLLILWMIARVLKTIFLETIYTFGGAYMIYCWYYNRSKEAFSMLLKAVIISVLIILIYSVIEVFYLLGNEIATETLIKINPILHEINTTNGWWPPLLWKEQIRSVFTEPSFFGIYAAFAMPFLWYKFIIVTKTKIQFFWGIIITSFILCIFLTKARTAVGLFFGECGLLFLYMLYLQRKLFIQKMFCILLCIIIAFFSANIVISNMVIESNKVDTNSKINIEGYLKDNIGSLVSTEKRSNMARYSVMIANFNIGVDYPFLGVGTKLNNAYVKEYLPLMSKNDFEINLWIKEQKELGILKSGFPNLCEYTSRVAQNGFLGLAIFLLPAIILLKNLMKQIRKNKEELIYGIFFISFISIIISGISNILTVTYCYWVLLGLGYALCENDISN